MNITIIINTVTTNGITVQVKQTDKVGDAKKKFYEKINSTKFNQWIYDADVLDDNSTFEQLKIVDKDEITANEASRGGLY